MSKESNNITDTVLKELAFTIEESKAFKDIIKIIKHSQKDPSLKISVEIQKKIEGIVINDIQ